MYTAGNDHPTPFFPILCTDMGDIPEAQRAACMMLGGAHLLQKPCWTCGISGVDLNLVQACEKRDFEALKIKIQNWNASLLVNTNVSQVLEEAKSESMYVMEVMYFLCSNFFVFFVFNHPPPPPTSSFYIYYFSKIVFIYILQCYSLYLCAFGTSTLPTIFQIVWNITWMVESASLLLNCFQNLLRTCGVVRDLLCRAFSILHLHA
jgi:hypothetical protein